MLFADFEPGVSDSDADFALFVFNNQSHLYIRLSVWGVTALVKTKIEIHNSHKTQVASLRVIIVSFLWALGFGFLDLGFYMTDINDYSSELRGRNKLQQPAAGRRD